MLAPRGDFLPTVIACTRPINISKDFEGGDVDPSLFQEPAERDLWDAYTQVAERADSVNLMQFFDLITSKLKEPIDRYFDDVLVMAKDEKLRRNRLAMCWTLTQLFRRIADFSLVVQA